MAIRKFEGNNLEEVLKKIKEKYGEKVDIVASREKSVKDGGSKKPRKKVEVYFEERGGEEMLARGYIGEWERVSREVKELKQTVETILAYIQKGYRPQAEPVTGEIEDSPRFMISTESSVEKWAGKLISDGVEPETVKFIMNRLDKEISADSSPEEVKRCLKRLLSKIFKTTGGARFTGRAPKIIAFIGPTGVGKTTTLAKIAAYARLKHKKRLRFITIDFLRLGAVDQLRQYAEILDIPMEVATTPEEFSKALRGALSGRDAPDVILIDTAGRSQRDSFKLNELREFLDVHPAIEVCLTVSATSSPKVLYDIVERFSEAVSVSNLILTKIDEAVSFGGVLNIAYKFGFPFSYLTNGQYVPDDIEVATPERLAELVLDGFRRRFNLFEWGES